MKQHLAEFLNKEIIKKVNYESDKSWALKKENITIPKYTIQKVDYPKWFKNLLKGTLGELRP